MASGADESVVGDAGHVDTFVERVVATGGAVKLGNFNGPYDVTACNTL